MDFSEARNVVPLSFFVNFPPLFSNHRASRVVRGCRAMASDRELGAPTRLIDVNGLRVHCLTAGGGDSPVVLLHGGGIDSASFTYGHIIGSLAQERHVFAPDWPGYGQSDKPDLSYAMGFFVDFLGRHQLILASQFYASLCKWTSENTPPTHSGE
jgi:hypothetical protein